MKHISLLYVRIANSFLLHYIVVVGANLVVFELAGAIQRPILSLLVDVEVVLFALFFGHLSQRVGARSLGA